MLSEYGITEVSDAVHLNRALREAGWLRVRDELGREPLDAGASEAFAVADHQIAHVYVRAARARGRSRAAAAQPAGRRARARRRRQTRARSRSSALRRAGRGLRRADRWFTYYYWLDDERAPDLARTVDIHRKPGYDPVELFIDPKLRLPKLRIATRLAQKMLGLRYLMDVISLDATLVRGSHGRPTDRPEDGPLFITSVPELLDTGPVAAGEVKSLLLAHVFGAAKPMARKTA